ncbi:hypothetical protein FJT64_003932 [Amphibalanus amphitrite]|uniref:Uncharacterized protein n=1 Tax=Amphibalanus amphitrite TaxID=1232801 RepID=A0A6A4VR97_AMPAM|nr:hypothetical protein FJT64_003932 [Amphibalanus amphitrite]
MLLVLGDSFAHWASHRCDLPASVVTAGRRGGRLDDEAFRRWAVGVVFRSRPERVLLVVGGNDLAGPEFNARHLHHLFEELVYGVLAAGAGQVTILPIPPRTACRPGGATRIVTDKYVALGLLLDGEDSLPDQAPAFQLLDGLLRPMARFPAPSARRRLRAGDLGLGHLRRAPTVTALTQAALAPATQRAYERTWRNLHTFLRLAPGAALFPVTTANVIEFVAACFDNGCGASALASHCSAIAYGHRIRGLPDPAGDFRVRKMLAGARRLRPSCDSRLALSLDDLTRLIVAIAGLALPVVEAAAFRAVFSVAFFAMLRPVTGTTRVTVTTEITEVTGVTAVTESTGRAGRPWHQCNGQAAVLAGSPPELAAAAPLRCPDSRSPVYESSRRGSPLYDSRHDSPIFESRRNSPIFEMRAVHVLPARAPPGGAGAGAGAAECHGLDLLHRHELAQRPHVAHVAHVHELHELHHECAMDMPVDMEEHLQSCRCHCDHMGYGNYQAIGGTDVACFRDALPKTPLGTEINLLVKRMATAMNH